jgi:hypothetical protein
VSKEIGTMRIAEEHPTNARHRDAPPTDDLVVRRNAVALLLAGPCVLALAVLVAVTFFATLALIYAPDAWSGVAPTGWEGS